MPAFHSWAATDIYGSMVTIQPYTCQEKKNNKLYVAQ